MMVPTHFANATSTPCFSRTYSTLDRPGRLSSRALAPARPQPFFTLMEAQSRPENDLSMRM
jgi:hypothetical protein